MKKSDWQFNWKITAFVMFFLPLCVGLGFWQLHRANEKRAIEKTAQQSQLLPAQSIESAELSAGNLAFRKVLIEGKFDNAHVFFLDNRTHQGKPGYEVLVPFESKQGNTYIVNRGWVAATDSRQILPTITAIQDQQQIEGYIYVPTSEPIVLAEDKLSLQWPKVVSKADLRQISGILQKQVFPYTIRLLQDKDDGLIRQWPVVNMSPMRHIGYAVQWFAMAVALIILFIWSIKKNAHEATE